ncbi:hypothetical protein [Costertonia aggregata]|uniref:Lipocalin family protein n=1 Tax=Costertonia aggregata TaxID=343403 RepID=A0A7H9AN19_9FLAO|nr:hypothetical protein [Costertonia aggregata]QLG44846.1 hypothetical protein HYG79_05595 [Costertonia aggregata]
MIKSKQIKFVLFNVMVCIFLLIAGCAKDEMILLEEIKLLGRWEPFSKYFVDANGNSASTTEEFCEYRDTYTFLRDNILFYGDYITTDNASCIENPDLLSKVEWVQNNNGKFVFTIYSAIDGSSFEN